MFSRCETEEKTLFCARIRFFIYTKASLRHVFDVCYVLCVEAAFSERTCREWFQRFSSGDFDVENRHGGGKEEISEDFELEALLAKDSYQTQEELS